MFVIAKQLVVNKLDVTFVTLLLEVMYQVSPQQLYINKSPSPRGVRTQSNINNRVFLRK